MSKNIKVSDEVYYALKIIKVYPSTSYNDIIKGLIDKVFPGEFFETEKVDHELLSEKNQTRYWV
jgi:predicted CopG family antitoxin